MIVRHRADRRPQGRHFAWSRKLNEQGVLHYRLWRRDATGKLHHNRFPLQYLSHAERRMIAKDLRIERQKLRDRVDEIDLVAMGVSCG